MGNRYKTATHITNVKNAKIVPIRMRYEAVRVCVPKDWLANGDFPLMIEAVNAE